MKRIFALILILAMLVPLAVACNSDDETTTTTTTENTATDGKFSSKDTVKKDWEGETLLVAATAWSAEPSYPWSTMELVIKEGETSGWGEKIDKAVLERTAYIKKTYGVDVIWEWASRYNTHDVLKNAIAAGNEPDYDLAMPRNFRAQAIVANGSVYDMANRPYINFNNSYYNQGSIEAYTAQGHTFFITGDFSNYDKELAHVMYFNKNLLGGDEEANKLYQLVRDGKWTWDKFLTYATLYIDNGDGRVNDSDTYGFYSIFQSELNEFFGIKRAGVNKATGEWEITLNVPQINDVISIMLELDKAKWSRHSYGGGWGYSNTDSFFEDKILFMNYDIYGYHQRAINDYGENVGVIPFPMLNEEQGRYYAPSIARQITLMCVPKTTSDRNMSDYFIDVLAWTGKEYVMEPYFEDLYNYFSSDANKEMLDKYIFPNISYDVGAAVGWGVILGSVFNYYSYGGGEREMRFEENYAKGEPEALETIKQWNEAWGGYTE